MLIATKMGPATGDRYRDPAVSTDGAAKIRGDLYRNRQHVSMRFMRNNEIVNSGKLETLKRQICLHGCQKCFLGDSDRRRSRNPGCHPVVQSGFRKHFLLSKLVTVDHGKSSIGPTAAKVPGLRRFDANVFVSWNSGTGLSSSDVQPRRVKHRSLLSRANTAELNSSRSGSVGEPVLGSKLGRKST